MGDIPYMPGAKKVVLDFGGNALLDETGAAELQADVAAANGAVMGSSLVRNPFTNTWRLAFDVKPEDKTKPVEMRAFLKTAKEPLSETWTYLWIP
jgi:glucans biosynthesis protein